MKKKKYIKPFIEDYRFLSEGLMITASPGISNEEFDPDNDEIGAKPGLIFEDDDWKNLVPTFGKIDASHGRGC